MSIYGNLTVICGPMYAGKTTEILKRILWARHEGKRVLVVKPSFDNRYSENEIVSHDGLSSPSMSITCWEDITNSSDYDLICFDEVQFFNDALFSGDIVKIVKGILFNGQNVVVNGLDMDWRGVPFEVTGKLMAMADSVVKLSANCNICGKPAYKTFKKQVNGSQVELGASELYDARCNAHWAYSSEDDLNLG